MPEIQYKRLTWSGPRGGFFVSRALQPRGSLWLGPDHLLSVETTGYTESYKRFYFRDIQALVVQKTRVFFALNVIVGVLALAVLLLTFALLADSHTGPQASAVILGFIAGVFGLIFLLNFVAGQSCKTFLRTAVQIEELPSLSRVKKTRRVLAKMHPLIVAAQGAELSPEAISTELRAWSGAASAPAPAVPEAAPAETPANEEDPNVPPRLTS